MKEGGDSCNAVLGGPGPGTSLIYILFSYLKHSGLGDNQQDVRTSIGLLQGHQFIHGPWLSELEWRALPTHPALAVHIPELVELGSWFGQVAGCGKNSPETQYDFWLSRVSRTLFLLGGEKYYHVTYCPLPRGRSLGYGPSSFLPRYLIYSHSVFLFITLTLAGTH